MNDYSYLFLPIKFATSGKRGHPRFVGGLTADRHGYLPGLIAQEDQIESEDDAESNEEDQGDE